MRFIMTSQNNGIHISNIVLIYPVIPIGLFTDTTKKRTLGLCVGWNGQWIRCVTRGREGGEGRGGRERGMEGERREGREGGRGGMTVIHIILMAAQYLYNNDVTLLFSALVNPHFEYACNAWYRSVHANVKHKLQTAQNKMIIYLLNYGCRRHVVFNDVRPQKRLVYLHVGVF